MGRRAPEHPPPHARARRAARVGRCAGLEWLPRWLPAPLRDRAVAKALAITELEPEMRAAAAALAASWPEAGKKRR